MLTSLALFLLTPGTPIPAETTVEPEPPGAPPLVLEEQGKEPTWTGSVDLGATVSNGNSDVVTAAASADAQRTWDAERLTLKAAWVFAQQADKTTGTTDVTQRRWNGSAKYDHFYDEATYAYGSVSGENDDLADLHLRSIYGAGLGHKFVAEEDLEFEGEAGLAYVDENYFSTVAPAKNADDNYVALRLAYNLKKVLSENTTFLQTAEAFPSLGFSEVNGTLDSRLKIQINESMHAQIQWIAKYNNNAPKGTGSTDTLWIFSLGWTY